MVTLTDIERESYKNSPIHRLDPRVKLLFALAIIIYVVSLPRIHEKNMIHLFAIEVYLLLLVLVSGLDLRYFFLRIVAILPFGLGIALIQPFLRPSFIENYTLYPFDLPLGLSITYEGLAFGSTLLAKFLVCITAIVLLSSTTRLRDMVSAADRMGIPREFTLLLSMMVRYLFLFWAVLKRIRIAQQTRLFDIWNKDVPRRWAIEQVGNSMSAIFIRSYEQGERTYISMLCRGYGRGYEKAYYRTKIRIPDIFFLLLSACCILYIHLYI
ncbi:cobalt transporter [Methanosarcina sp. 2.H.T.1A.6]|uniref:cobalt ECF transporter T component CbiQ n=1 Tax=unclassified Methanosarcina TaxID=2644672 RepID=UPI0006213461|nr:MULTISPECIES: cobalt ECF transporter T component CbiQ [unclassified Methanosarcina]KKG13010.1 cobalt transporter [Methanosarcina sp. 2.H.T.1A.15]KKG13152.1 cobalt transporter [Methanosarcina sp. 2.H.A.1B.4]KKG14228.1 cobalt transporter [Methanosarcina sp. 2.H.T.1A.3]KKG19718.1 cobalt transporter [Methanosarcina sp. 2.H.T.1A.6]KKG27105.1 cobalt transporter [Methanosarcina sp. 2.H.T.1A.8]